jgi:hypothetical protein
MSARTLPAEAGSISGTAAAEIERLMLVLVQISLRIRLP